MKSTFIHDGFLLRNKYSEELYHGYAKALPIIDYHNHLSPKQLAEDTVFDSITSLWIYGDHYKWRAMRTLGIDEKYITGNATDKEKFEKWGYTVPYAIGNPLYHWTHLEMARYFEEYSLLTEDRASLLYEKLNEKIKGKAYSARNLIKGMQVEYLCTTDDPIDDLQYHKVLRESNFKTKVRMTFRPDNALMIEGLGFMDYLGELEEAADLKINSYDTFLQALEHRMDYFNDHGCIIADHGLPNLYASDYTDAEIKTVFEERCKGKLPNNSDALKFKSAVLRFLCESYHDLGWTQQFHIGPLRNTNSRLFKKLGPDMGFDSIGDRLQAEDMAKFLDTLDCNNKLTQTILYNLNPADNAIFATMIGNFNDGSTKGKVQWGSGWWFLDQKDGMEQQMKTLANMGLVSCFIGMLTDSRSLLSFPRHEYFRRILSNFFGSKIENGEFPNDIPWIGKLIQDICYHNAKQYFKL